MLAGIVLLPVFSLAIIAFSGSGEDWPHLVRNVLPGAVVTTVQLLAMVAAGTAIIGVAAAWLVAGYEFPLRRHLSWMLVLPLAVPPYLQPMPSASSFCLPGHFRAPCAR